MTEKLPYWEHPQYDPWEDPASGIVQFEILAPITEELPYAVISECTCFVLPEQHEPDFVEYKFGKEFSENFPSVCPTRNYSDPGDLILHFRESNNTNEFSVSIRRVREGFYLLSYELHPLEPPYDSGEEAAWEGGNVDIKLEESSESEKLEFEVRLQNEIEELVQEDSKYEPYPPSPPCRDAILIKTNAKDFSNSLYEFLKLNFENLTRILSIVSINGEIPDQIKFRDWVEFNIQKELDLDFFAGLNSCFQKQN